VFLVKNSVRWIPCCASEGEEGRGKCSGCMWKGGGMEGWRVERRTERMMEGWRNRRMGRKEEGREGKMEGWKDEGSLRLERQLRSSSPTIWSSGVVEVCNRERMVGWKGDLCTFAPKRDQLSLLRVLAPQFTPLKPSCLKLFPIPDLLQLGSAPSDHTPC